MGERKNRRSLGSFYEQQAATFLEERGWHVLERNYRCSQGEIDLICRDKEALVFVEVKYRSDDCFGEPMEAVDGRKQGRIRKTAAVYLGKRKLPFDTPCRFDVVGIGNRGIELVENAF